MNHTDRMTYCAARMKKRRKIEALLCLPFLIIAITYTILYDMSRTVVETQIGPLVHQSVSYNYDLAWGILIGALGLTICGCFWVVDRIGVKLFETQVGTDKLLLYRGILHTDLYLNGEHRATTTFAPYLEATLSDRSKVTVVLHKWSVHILFSNGHPSIDL